MQSSISPKMTLATLLRRFGTVTLVVAGASFLFEGWHTLTSMERYLSFLGFTLVLTVIGVFCGRTLGEPKGARTFLGLAAASLTAHFGQLASAICTAVQQGSESIATWSGPMPVGVVAAGGVLASLPVALLGFSALQRQAGKRLSTVYLVLNALVLFPFRGTPAALAVLILATAIFLAADFLLTRGKTAFELADGSISRLLVGAPLMLIYCRSWMSAQSVVQIGIQILIGTVVFFFFAPSFEGTRRFKAAIQGLSLPLFAVGWLPIGITMASSGQGIFFCGVPLAAIWIAASFAASGPMGRVYRSFGAYSFAFTAMMAMNGEGVELASLVAVVGAMALIALALMTRERNPLAAGILAAILGFGRQLIASLEFWVHTPWLSLLGIGLCTLLVAVYLEKNADKVKTRLVALKARLSQWN